MNIGDAKAALPRKARGANLDDIQGITDFTLFREAGSNLLRKLDPFKTQRRQVLTLYRGVTDYPAWSDLKGNRIIALNRQGKRRDEKFSQTYTEEIEGDDPTLEFGVAYENGNKLLRVSRGLGGAVTVDETDSDDNWAASGTASNLLEDDLIFEGGGIRFDAANGTAILTFTRTDALDLSDAEGQSTFFREVFIDDPTLFTSVTLRIGSSAAAYWEITGEPAFGSSFVEGINLVKFDWNGVAPTGAADSSAIDYERLAFAVTGTIEDLRIGPMVSAMPIPYEGVYYSDCLFRGTDGTFKRQPTDDDDEVLLELEEEEAFLYECAKIIAEDMQRQGAGAKFDAILNGDANEVGIYSQLKTLKPSQAKRVTHRWWKPIRFHNTGGGSAE